MSYQYNPLGYQTAQGSYNLQWDEDEPTPTQAGGLSSYQDPLLPTSNSQFHPSLAGYLLEDHFAAYNGLVETLPGNDTPPAHNPPANDNINLFQGDDLFRIINNHLGDYNFQAEDANNVGNQAPQAGRPKATKPSRAKQRRSVAARANSPQAAADDDNGNAAPGQPTRRSGKCKPMSCEECRRIKGKCVRTNEDGPCDRCVAKGLGCQRTRLDKRTNDTARKGLSDLIEMEFIPRFHAALSLGDVLLPTFTSLDIRTRAYDLFINYRLAPEVVVNCLENAFGEEYSQALPPLQYTDNVREEIQRARVAAADTEMKLSDVRRAKTDFKKWSDEVVANGRLIAAHNAASFPPHKYPM
ncbi:putative Zn(2)-C6 fungal-type domain-containing protein [Seiridium cardinale]|uniref:Zn(2)-C6 fungal-type domain-containing protein n=1 Tax=Seiridium cardinale TaxID=138064 RepID=A0ABR2XEK4_9PEZI